MSPSSAAPSSSPTSPAAPPRSSCGMLMTFCASPERCPLFSPPLLPNGIHSATLPIVPFAPAPFCVLRLHLLLWSVGWLPLLEPIHLTTRLLKSPYPTSPLATALPAAQHEAAEAHWSDL